LSWIREYARLDAGVDSRQVYEALVRAGLEVENVEKVRPAAAGPIVVGRVLSCVCEPQKNGKTIAWCRVDCGSEHNASVSSPAGAGEPASRGIVCGAPNVAAGQLVVVALPGAELPGGFQIAARKTYGHISDGMICAEDELGLGDGHAGILTLPAADDAGRPLVPGEPALPLLCQSDDVFDIAVTPDMGYCLSIRGVAREAAQAFKAPFRDPAARPASAPVLPAGLPVRLETAGCPLFAAVTVEGFDPAQPSPRWLAGRLQLAGMRSISLAVDVTNYVMLEIGQPIHGYDADRLEGGIAVRQAEAGEQLVTLDGTRRSLDPSDLVIADGSGVIGLAGVMGGEATELGPTTTRIVIEAAFFDPVAIGATAKRHKLPSEASRRFERGVDPAAAASAAHRVAALLTELGGGRVTAETTAGAIPAAPVQTIAADLPGRVLGHLVSQAEVEAILRASGVQVAADGPRLTLTPPTWRPDLRDPYDFAEEVGRKIGFDIIEPVVPKAPPGRGRTHAQRLRQSLVTALPAAGWTEVVSFPFASAADLDKLGVGDDDERRSLVLLANPLADTSPALRTTLLPGLFAAVARNRSRGLDDVALYEQGLVFFGPAGQAPALSVLQRPAAGELAALEAALPRQPRHLACVAVGQWRPAGWAGPGEAAGWRHAVAFAEATARLAGLAVERQAVDQPPWHPGRCAALTVAGQIIGHAGELHSAVAQAYGLPDRVAAAELDLDALLALAPGPGRLPPLSAFPVAKEDIALIVDEATPQAAVAAALREGAGDLLESLALFDVYRGAPVPAGRKSLAFALRFRAPGRTLTEAEAAAARDAATAVAVSRFGAVARIA
jgi:phenylalanyl-tRNA synthetase beta chain